MPWAKLQFAGIGIVQEYKAPQWVAGGQIRSYGFAGDEHGAASSIVALFILFSMNIRKSTFYVVAAIALVAIELTTSRTNLISFVVFVGLYLFSWPQQETGSRSLLKRSLRLSFLAPILPIVIIGISLSFTVDTFPDSLQSLWIRGNEAWLAPFNYTDVLAPFAIIHGFGLGGVGFGLLQSHVAKYYTAVDNFILFNYLSFGMPYIIFYLYQCRRMSSEREPYKIMSYIVTAIDGLTLRGWSDSPFMLLFGYSTSRVFSGGSKTMGHGAILKMHSRPLRRSAC